MLTINPAKVNAAAAKRILGLPQSRKIEIQVSDQSVAITHRDRTGTHTAHLTLSDFDREFTRYRQEGAKECIATPHKRGTWGEMYAVAGSNGEIYYVEAGDTHLACTCEDWHQHEETCKHGWAVLQLVGASSFEHYLAARKMVNFSTPKVKPRCLVVNGISIE